MRTFAFTAVFTAVAAMLIAAYLVYAAGTKPTGTTWSNNALRRGVDLELIDSGEYVARPWCDVCPQQSFHGHWVKVGAVVTLTPDSKSDPSKFLRQLTRHGCTILVPERDIDKAGDFNPFSAYARKGDKCLWRLFDGPAPKMTRRSSSNKSFKPNPLRGSA